MLGSASLQLLAEEDGRHAHRGLLRRSRPQGRADSPRRRDHSPRPTSSSSNPPTATATTSRSPTRSMSSSPSCSRRSADQSKVLVPTFAVGRAQLLTALLAWIFRNHRSSRSRCFSTAPWPSRPRDIYARHRGAVRRRDARVPEGQAAGAGSHHDETDGVTPDDSRKINDCPGPCLVMAGAGMCTAGRILHHLKPNLWNPQTHVIIVGLPKRRYAGAPAGRGRKAGHASSAS